jgi:hypothetical protein
MDYQAIALVVLVLLIVVTILYRAKPKPRIPYRKLIKERQVKLIFNPFSEKWMWTQLNPKSRTWEWKREATPDEIEKYKDVVFPEKQGEWMLNSVADEKVDDNG